MPKASFVARFDIAAYYTSMRHDVIKAQVAATDLDAHHRKLIADYLALPDSHSVSPVPSLSTTKRPFGIAFLAMLIALVATLRGLCGKGHRSLA
jgi:hypothetical protein